MISDLLMYFIKRSNSKYHRQRFIDQMLEDFTAYADLQNFTLQTRIRDSIERFNKKHRTNFNFKEWMALVKPKLNVDDQEHIESYYD